MCLISNSFKLLHMSLLPATLMMIQYKNEQASMETSLSYYKSKRTFSANSTVSGRIWPKYELIPNFIHTFVTCKFITDYINSNREKVKTLIFRCSMAGNSVASGPIWPKYEPMEDIMHFHVRRIGTIAPKKKWRHRF